MGSLYRAEAVPAGACSLRLPCPNRGAPAAAKAAGVREVPTGMGKRETRLQVQCNFAITHVFLQRLVLCSWGSMLVCWGWPTAWSLPWKSQWKFLRTSGGFGSGHRKLRLLWEALLVPGWCLLAVTASLGWGGT